MNENQQFGFLDIITIFSAIIQIMDYTLTVEQASNDDVLKELKKDMLYLKSQNQAIIEAIKSLSEQARFDTGFIQDT